MDMEFQGTEQVKPFKAPNSKNIRNYITLGLIVVLGLIIVFNGFTTVQSGFVGVKKTLGKLDSGYLSAGLHFKIPFMQEIILVNTQVLKSETQAAASSKDMQTTHTSIVVNYRVDEAKASNLLSTVGPSYANIIIAPAIQEVLKATTSRYSAEELVTKRETVAVGIKEGLEKKLVKYDLIVTDISITNFEFEKAFNDSIEAKQVAAQQAIKAENDLRRIEIEAKQKIAEAGAEAEALRLKKQEITPDLVLLKQIEVQEKAVDKWDGKLPNVTGGTVPFINVDSTQAVKK
jgi:regulator of protease activity HflC (stomatin/prohibitin superfamily)